MNLRNVAFSTLLIASVAAPAVAGGTQSINRTVNTRTQAHGKTNINVNSYMEGTRTTDSQTVKVETFAPDAGISIHFDGDKIKASGYGSTLPANPDPWGVISNTEMSETVNFGEDVTVQINEKYKSFTNESLHNVGSESF